MSDDELEGFVGDLFSDLSPPEPEGEEEPSAPLEEMAPEVMEEPPDQEEIAELPDMEDVRSWREWFVQRVLRILAVLAIPPLLFGAYYAYTTGSAWVIPLYLVAYGALLLVTFLRGISYTVQAISMLVLTYGVGVLDLVESGRGGDGRVFLLAVPPLAVALLGVREGLIAIGIDVLTLALFGWLYTAEILVIPVERQANFADPYAWLSNTVILTMLGSLLVATLGYLIPRLSAALIRSQRLTRELEDHRVELETQRARLEERTRALQEANYAIQRRAIQLEASAEVGRAIASIFDVDQLLRRSVDLIRDRFGFYHAAIYLLDETGEWVVLKEATGDVGQEMKARGVRLAVGDDSMIGWTAARRQSRLALDTQADMARFDHAPLPHTRSEVTLPLMVGGRLLGVLDVQSTEEAAFDSDDVRTLQSMADQVAVAIDNARRFTEEAALLEATSPIYRASRRLTTATSPDEVLDIITGTVIETDVEGYVMGLFEPFGSDRPEEIHLVRTWRRDRRSSIQPGMRVDIRETPTLFEAYTTRWVADDLEEATDLPEETRPFVERAGGRAVANFPLQAGDLQAGFFFIYRMVPGPFSESTLRLCDALSDQAAMALERARLLEVTRRQAEEEAALRAISDRVGRAMDVEAVLQGAVEELGQVLQASGVYIELGPGLSVEGSGRSPGLEGD